MTREEAIRTLRKVQSEVVRGSYIDEVYDMAIEALKRERTDEWCTDCKEYDTEKKCCPRFNKVIREAMKHVPHEDGTLEVKVDDATKVGRVLISDDKHRGGLYYPDEDEPQSVSFENDTEIKSCSKDSDLISRTEAYRRITELSQDLLSDGCINLGNASEYLRIIRELPSADRPRGEWIETAQDYYETLNKKGGGVNEGTEYFTDDIACSECLTKFSNIDNETERFNFCPNCGAEMITTKGEK